MVTFINQYRGHLRGRADLRSPAKRSVEWTGSIAGALPEADLLALLTQIGFRDVAVTDRFD